MSEAACLLLEKKKMENFGFKKVSKKEKPKLVNKVFDSVAFKYDLMNDLMSDLINLTVLMLSPRRTRRSPTHRDCLHCLSSQGSPIQI